MEAASGGEAGRAGPIDAPAARWASEAAALEEALRDHEDGELRFGLGVARWWLGETATALGEWQHAYAAFRREDRLDRATIAAFYLCLAYRMSLGNDAAARGWLARAERLVQEPGAAALRGWVLVARAHVEIDAGRPAAAEPWASEAAELARAARDVDLELCALSELGAALVEQGRIEAGAMLIDEAMAAALGGEGRDPDAVVMISCRTITACSRGGDVRRATQWVRAADEFRQRYGSPHLYATCRTQYGALLAAIGELAPAEHELAAALRIARGAEPALHAEALAALAEVRLAQGRTDEAARLLAGLEDQPSAAIALARLRIALGEHAVAGSLVRRRLRRIDGASLEGSALGELLALVEIHDGHAEAAEARGRRLAEVGERTGSELIMARGQRVVGRARLAAHRSAAAIEPLEHAVAAFGTLGMALEVARTRLVLAQAMSGAGLESASAVAEAQTAFQTFIDRGANGDADAAASLLRSLGARARRTGPAALGGLTRRESEVLALLGEGLSNPEIGRRLFITRKTVEHHVASCLAKLGLSGRAEAAAYAARHMTPESARK